MPPSIPLTQEPPLAQNLRTNSEKRRAEVNRAPLATRQKHVGRGSKESYRKRKIDSTSKKTTEENILHNDTAQVSQDSRTSDLANYNSSMMGYGGMGMGMGMGMGPMSPYSSPYGMMGMGMGPSTGPLANFNQLLFGFQSLVYSLGQAMQVRLCVR